MTDYKLVPNLRQIVTDALVGMVSAVTQMVPPTDEPLPDFIQAPIDRAVTRISAEIEVHSGQSAPAVQGEPVGWQFYQDGKWWYGDDRIKDHRKNTEEAGYPVRDVYAAPQPAEQKPSAGDSLTSVPDEAFAAEFAAWWEEHGQFCRAGGGDYERTFAFEAWRHLYPKLMNLYPKLMNLQMATAEQQPDVAQLVDAAQALADVCRRKIYPQPDKPDSAWAKLKDLDAALAAHRKGG